MYPLVEISHGQVWYYFRQDDLWSDVPPQAETSCGQVCYNFGQANLWSHVPLSQISGFGSGWHLVRLLVMLTFSYIHLLRASGGEVWYHIRHLQWKTSFCLYVLRQLNHERPFTQEDNYLGLSVMHLATKMQQKFFFYSSSTIHIFLPQIHNMI